MRWSIPIGEPPTSSAVALYITEGTAKNHVTSILGTLGARDRTEAVHTARELGLL